MFFISLMIGLSAFLLSDFSSNLISKVLLKNHYTAASLMQDDYTKIDTKEVVENGGGIQVINSQYEIVFSKGLNTLGTGQLTPMVFTDFLMSSQSTGIPYSYSIEYNPNAHFWLVVTFPTSIRIDFSIVHNKDFISQDMKPVSGVIAAIILFYLLLLAASTVIYSKLTALSIINPLKKFCISARKLRDGDFSARVDSRFENEFGELREIFNAMAEKIEQEISLRKQLEHNHKRLVLDISHDLKNPLASIMGYAELCCLKKDLSEAEWAYYAKIIHENSIRANHLITSLFELSKLESSEFKLNKVKIDCCEYLRETMGTTIPLLEEAGFAYNMDIPEEEIYVMLDPLMMDRVFQNLTANTLIYNPAGTVITVTLLDDQNQVVILFKDDGIGMSKETAKEIFDPFVRVDRSRNSQTGGTGLGLAIVKKIIEAHHGTINLKADEHQGCAFYISLPKFKVNLR